MEYYSLSEELLARCREDERIERTMAKRGLPERSVMRHDSHYVEELTKRSGRHIGTMLPLEFIEPNAEQPRTQLGNIEELAASVREKGVLEPILVRPIGPNRYQIISGERRFRAATLAGLDEIPAIELDVDDKEQLEIALIENIQRKDLTPFEEAEGLYVLQQKFGYTHEKISQVIGKSRTTVTETLLINDIPDRIRAHVPRGRDLEQERARAGGARRLGRGDGAGRARVRGRGDVARGSPQADRGEARAEEGRAPEEFHVFALKDKSLPFTLNLAFKKPNVEKSEVIEAVRELLRRLESE